jgi:hypothetical protein
VSIANWPWDKIAPTIAAITALIGAGAPALANASEAISLRTRRRKELQHIQDLTDLMDKIKKQNVLSQSTLENVCEQIEAEIGLALDALHGNRQHRLRIMEARKENDHSDLGFLRRGGLIYRPHGVRGWIASYLFFMTAVFGFAIVFGSGVDDAGDFTWRRFLSDGGWIALIVFIGLLLVVRLWALRERASWLKLHPDQQIGSGGAEAPRSPETQALPAAGG